MEQREAASSLERYSQALESYGSRETLRADSSLAAAGLSTISAKPAKRLDLRVPTRNERIQVDLQPSRQMLNESTQTPNKERKSQGKILDSYDVGPPIKISEPRTVIKSRYADKSPLKPVL